MNVYGGRSTVPGDVKKWSNECDARHAAPDRDAVRCTLAVLWWSCQGCIWCRCHQMHWRLFEEVIRAASDADVIRCTGDCLMKLSGLHLMPMPSDALAVECDVRTAASDRETARCTLAVVCWWSRQCCIWCRCHQMHWRLSRCQNVALNPKAIRWEAVDAQIAAPDRDEVRCIGEFLLMPGLLHPTAMQSGALAKLFDCQAAASNAEAVGCTGEIVWREQNACWTVAFLGSFSTNETSDRWIWSYRFNRCVFRIVSNRWNSEITVSYSRQQISLTRYVFKIVVKQIVSRKDAAVWSMHKALINVDSLRRAELRASITADMNDQGVSWWTRFLMVLATWPICDFVNHMTAAASYIDKYIRLSRVLI